MIGPQPHINFRTYFTNARYTFYVLHPISHRRRHCHYRRHRPHHCHPHPHRHHHRHRQRHRHRHHLNVYFVMITHGLNGMLPNNITTFSGTSIRKSHFE